HPRLHGAAHRRRVRHRPADHLVDRPGRRAHRRRSHHRPGQDPGVGPLEHDQEGELTMKTKKTLALPVMAATVALALGGCVAVDNTPVSAPRTETTAPATTETAPAEDEVEEQPVDDEAEPSDGGGEDTEAPQPSDAGGESEDESPAPEVEKIDLTPESETAVVYLRSIQGFSPELEVWTIDEEAGMVEYRRYNCLGSAQGVGVGTFAPREGGDEGEYRIIWEGENPGPAGNGDSQEERATMTERNLEVDMNVASTHHDIELERFGGMCGDTASTAVQFVL